MIYKCKICKFKTNQRKWIRQHIRQEHKDNWKMLREEKNDARKAGKPFRHAAPLSGLYVVVKDE